MRDLWWDGETGGMEVSGVRCGDLEDGCVGTNGADWKEQGIEG